MTVNITVYADGSSDGKSGGVGGWAYVILIDGIKFTEGSGSEKNATNNVCEILAASKGLEAVADYMKSYSEVHDHGNYRTEYEVVLVSDSQLALKWATGEYDVKKYHLVPYVIALRDIFRKTNAKTRWERGHQGEPNNERCDLLAKTARTSRSTL